MFKKIIKEVTLICNSNKSYYDNPRSIVDVYLSICKRVDDNTFKEITCRTSCKDYIGDAYAASMLGTDSLAMYNKLTEDFDPEEIALCFITNNAETAKLMIKNLRLLNKIEFECGLKPTVGYLVKDSNCFVTVGDKYWYKSTLIISLYVQIIRMLNLKSKAITKLSTHIKEFISKRGTHRDSTYFNIINEANIDIPFLIKNIDAITNGNPITGLDDEAGRKLGDNFRLCRLSDNSKLRPKAFLKLPFEGNLYQREVEVNFENNHSYSGIKSFAENIKYIKKIKNKEESMTRMMSIMTHFSQWAINYMILKKELDTIESCDTIVKVKAKQ